MNDHMQLDISTAVQFITGVLLVLLCTQARSIDLTEAGYVNQVCALEADKEPGNWLLLGRDFESQHYSPLTQIHNKNIEDLRPAWYVDVPSLDGLVATPVVFPGERQACLHRHRSSGHLH